MNATSKKAQPTHAGNKSPRKTEDGRYFKVFGTEAEHWAWKAAAARDHKELGEWVRAILNAEADNV